jgi:replicative superfamily II helicase
MVFVHSRKDTLETAKKLVEMSKLKGEEHFFKSENAAYKFIEQLKH